MPNHPTDGAQDATAELQAAGIPAVFAHAGGNVYTCLVPLDSDDTTEAGADRGAHLVIIGDELCNMNDRYAIYVREREDAEERRLLGGANRHALLAAVRALRSYTAADRR